MKYDVLFYANISSTQTPQWALIGKGVSSFDGASNPETEDVQYINEKTKTTTTKSLTPSYTMSMDVIHGDAFNDYMYEMALAQKTNQKVEICRVELKNPGSATNEYRAQKGTYGITVDSFDGGAGGDKVTVGATFAQEGEVVDGDFVITSGSESFSPDSSS
jgi:hypothetical protein